MGLGSWDEIRDKLNLPRLGAPALAGMAAILAVVVAAAAFILAGPATASDFSIERGEAATGQGDGGQSAPAETLFVHVSGAVREPGLHELEAGSRVADAVDAAGGFADDAAADSCNLARVVEDGEHIIIGTVMQEAGDEGGSAGGVQAMQGGLLNINAASADELESLPGIGQATAAKIVSDRIANGPFSSVEDLKRVGGIGDKKLEALRDLICV